MNATAEDFYRMNADAALVPSMPQVCKLLTGLDVSPDLVAAHFKRTEPSLSTSAREAEVFDFGDATGHRIGDRLAYMIDLFVGGFIDTPFRVVLYKFGHDLGRCAMLVERVPVPKEHAGKVVRIYRGVCYLQEPGRTGHVLLGACVWTFTQEHPEAVGVVFTPSAATREHGDRLVNFAYEGEPEVIKPIQEKLREDLAYWFLRCALVLSTDGVPRRVQKASQLLNAERVRKGKPRIPTVTHIDFAAYQRALDAGEPGHHASPVPHLRRGHIRRLADGRRTWVRDCLVNASSDVKTNHRARYQVHAPPAEADTGAP